MQLASAAPPATLPLVGPRCPSFVEHDLLKAFQLLQRHPSVRDFMLDASSPAHDVILLTTPRPSFTIFTEEEQKGALTGRIAMRYLGIPAFSDCAGLSGGAVVTSYADRTHPLHAPNVMADVRVGRYIRDNRTGEWCILTRNPRDGIIRLQYIRVNHLVTRERICLTCSSDLFNAGHFLASVLFQCHDREWRPCPFCGALPQARCHCAMKSIVAPGLKGLAGVAETVAREGLSRWVGKVRVTVFSNLSRSDLLDIDECMDVEASYQPSIDSALAADMQRLAIFETVNSATVVPKSLPDPFVAASPPATFAAKTHHEAQPDSVSTIGENDEQLAQSVKEDLTYADGSLTTSSSEDFFEDTTLPLIDDVLFDDILLTDPKYDLPYFVESPMLPADPSTLPGGIELCMDGMDLEEDFCSFITNEKDLNSSIGSGGSDGNGFILENESLVPNICADTPKIATTYDTREDCADNCSQIAAVRVVLKQNQGAPGSLPREDEGNTQQQLLDEASNGHTERSQQTLQNLNQKQRAQEREQPIAQVSAQMSQHLQPHIATQSARTQSALSVVSPKQEELLHAEPLEKTGPKPQSVSRGARLAPRPAGMGACSDGFIWQMGNAHAIAARLEATERERKAEERRKKNRQAAARSNARKKGIMDAYKAEIKQENERVAELRRREFELRRENRDLKRQMDMSI